MVLRRLHTWEFKEDVVARANEEGTHIPDLARELAINSTMIRRWQKEKAAGRWEGHPSGAVLNAPKRKYNKPGGLPVTSESAPKPKSTSNSEELETLKLQVLMLTRENELLRKMVEHYIKLQPTTKGS